MTDRKMVDMGFTDEPFEEGVHMCLIYDDDSTRLDLLAEYLKGGVDGGEFVTYFSHSTSEKAIQDSFGDIASNENKLNIAPATGIYCPGNHFKMHDMLNTIGSYYHGALDQGFSGIAL